jgi:LPXTG-motif cell wall-anchored protein
VPVVAHAGGADEALMILLPLAMFLVLGWLSRRKRRR